MATGTHPTVKLAALKNLAEKGQVDSTFVTGLEGGYAITVLAKGTEHQLVAKHGGVRLFTTLDTAAKTLGSVGVTIFAVRADDYKPGRIRPERPEVKAAMERIHAAAKHDAWFRSEVEKALAKHKAGTAQVFTGAEIRARLRERLSKRTEGVE